MKKILFVCVHNSARSQMAEGLANSLGGGKLRAWSAGSTPTQVYPLAVKVMGEIGVDISGQASKSFAEVADLEFDYVITLCGEGDIICPTFPGQATRFHWPQPDPAAAKGSEEERLTAFRDVRDALLLRIRSLI
ncbi:MAG: arsenate reductase ArsC [Actinomycetota bacterium]